MEQNFNHSKKVVVNIGAGLFAGAAGTAVMMVSQKITKKINGIKPDEAIVTIAKKIFHYHPSKTKETVFANAVTFSYGSANGIIRSVLSFAGIKNFTAIAIHFGIITTMVITVEPLLDVAPPLQKRNPAILATNLFHHAVYTLATGFVFDKLIKHFNRNPEKT